MENANRFNEKHTVSKKPLIPNCDFLFNEQVVSKGKRKTPFLRNIAKKNAFSLILSSILFVVQSLPVWVTPLITANIINAAIILLNIMSAFFMNCT